MKLNMQAATFLLVDDDAVGIVAVKRALRNLKISNETLVANDGRKALEILEAAVAQAGGNLPPFIITLDMHMPRMNGAEFLVEIAKHPVLKSAIVLAFDSDPFETKVCSTKEHLIAGRLCKDNTKSTLGSSLEGLEQRSTLLEYSV
ncbi:MAG: response regulator [Roseobacter sp.]